MRTGLTNFSILGLAAFVLDRLGLSTAEVQTACYLINSHILYTIYNILSIYIYVCVCMLLEVADGKPWKGMEICCTLALSCWDIWTASGASPKGVGIE